MNVELECEPVRTGHVRLRLVMGMATIEHFATWFSEALDEVAGAVEALLRGHPSPRAILVDAPTEYRWLFDSEPGGRVRVRVLEFPDYPSGRRDEEARTLLDATCGTGALATAVVACVAKLQNAYGVQRFEDLAKMQLPVHRREAIESLLANAGA